MAICATRRGFTIIETVAGIAALSAISTVLAPIGGHIQANNLDTRSQWVHHDLARRQMMYVADHNGQFTGPNTSGLEWNREPIGGFPNKGIETLAFDTDGGNPTSQGDWITPLVGDAYGFSANRAIRMQQMLEVIADPTATHMNDWVFSDDGVEDIDQVALALKNGGYRQRSFLQVRSFSHFSNEHRLTNIVHDTGKGFLYIEHFAVQSQASPAMTPKGYQPTLWNVGMQPANKVMFADGTRRFATDQGLSISARLFQGGFTDHSTSSPILDFSVAYGREYGQALNGENLDLSFRKQGGEGMYVSMFDGSLQYLTREEAWTDPTPWYPTGSVWTGINATAESQAWVKKNLTDGTIH